MITADEVAELRSLLRRRDPVIRQFATAELAAWPARELRPDAARGVLLAAVEAYPSLPGDSSHPADLFARVLWSEPCVVSTGDVCRTFLLAGERVRRTLLTLLAIRGDEAGLAAIEHLLSSDGPTELLPTPTTPVLDPLMTFAEPDRLVDLLLPLLGQSGWTWHAAELLSRLERDGLLTERTRAALVAESDVVVQRLVDLCDRATIRVATQSDPTRSDRESLATVVRMLAAIDSPAVLVPLQRVLSSADPRVAAMAAPVMLRRGDLVADERLHLIAKDPMARAVLHAEMADDPRRQSTLSSLMDPVGLQESQLVRWLSQVTEVGFGPDEIDFVTALRVDPATGNDGDSAAEDSAVGDSALGDSALEDMVDAAADGDSALGDSATGDSMGGDSEGDAPASPGQNVPADPNLWVFRFRMRPPHWSSARGWMIGTAGVWTHSCYNGEDDMDMAEHVDAIRRSLVEWPGRF